jgi:hypothetical protein
MRITKNKVIGTVASLGLAAGAFTGVVAATASTPAMAQTVSVVKPSVVAPLFGTWHKMTVTLNGTTYTGYWVYMVRHTDGALTGWLYDGNQDTVGVPGYLPLHGDASGDVIQFNAKYPAGDPQGDRAFVAINTPGSLLSGIWQETGSEAGSGTFAFLN